MIQSDVEKKLKTMNDVNKNLKYIYKFFFNNYCMTEIKFTQSHTDRSENNTCHEDGIYTC